MELDRPPPDRGEQGRTALDPRSGTALGDPPSKTDRRFLHHVLQAEFCAALVILTEVDWAAKDASWWATTFQFVGALVTFGGLLWAYIRARFGLGLWELLDLVWARVELLVRRLLGKRRDLVIRPSPAMATLRMDTPTVLQGFGHLDRSLSIEGQLAQLEAAIKNLEGWFKPIRDDLHDLRHQIEAVRARAESSAQKALAEIEAKIKKLTAELNESQALDLRWAIGGLFISAIGTALQFWA